MLQSFFTAIWLVDFEYSAPPGELPEVVCMVAREFFTGRTLRYWRDELLAMREAPFNVGADALFVAFYASAEIGCFLALGWSMPTNILDLYAEFRCMTNGLTAGSSLVAALQHYGLPSIDVVEKDTMRALAMRGGEYTKTEQQALLEYCESDVLALDNLLRMMM